MERIEILKKHREQLKAEVVAHLDSFIIGTLAKSPAMSGYGLTTKVKQKTVSLYVRKNMVQQVQEMTRRFGTLWTLIQELSKVNWEILKLESK